MKYFSTGLAALLFFFSSVVVLSAQNKDSIEGDFEALQDLYEVTDGDNWKNNSGWQSMTPETMGDAYGVTVNAQGRVTDLVLIDNNLVNYQYNPDGSVVKDADGKYILVEGMELRETIGNLQSMTHIAIQRNRLTGPIPDSFWTLPSLVYAFISYNMTVDLRTERWPYPSKGNYAGNKFTGSLPPEIGNMTSLKRLYLDRNYFTGTELPLEIGNLTNLEHLSLNKNGFINQIPSSIGKLKNLEILHLNGGAGDDPRFTAPTTSNSYSGAIPTEIGGLTNVRSLRLSYNRFTGGFPLSFANMSSLQSFIVADAGLDGEFPNHINNDNNPKMTSFFISDNNLSGSIDPNWNGSFLDVFTVVRNNIGGELPKCFTDSTDPNFNPKLKMFTIQENNFEGDFADTLEDWFRPRRIMMHTNNFSGPLPDVFPIYSSPESGERLMALSLSNNGFTGSIPLGLGAINSNLSFYIGLSNNNLSGYEAGAISRVIVDLKGDYVSGLRGMGGLAVNGNDLAQSDLDQIILDVWDNVKSRIGTAWEETGSVNVSNQSTGAVPSYSSEVNSAITNLSAAGWNVIYDGWENDDRAVDLADAPSLLSPSDQATNLSLTPTFEWEDTGAALYKLEILESSSMEQILMIEQEQTEYTPETELEENTGYIWRVRSIDGGILSDWSESREFTTLTTIHDTEDPITAIPSLLSPSDKATNLSLTPTLEWEDTGAALYKLEILESTSNEIILMIEQEQTEYTPETELKENTGYTWRVRSIDGGLQSDWSASRTFTTLTANDDTEDPDTDTGSRIFPESPLLLGPVDNELNSTVTPEFRWAAVEGADYYTLHMSRNSPSGMVIDVTVEDTVYAHPEHLGDNSVHNWRVRAVKDGEPGEWSEIFELQTEDAGQPQMADLVSPDHFTQNVSVSPRFEWGQVDSDLFEVRIINKVTSETVLTDELSGYQYTPDEPLAGETAYIWQVKNIKDGIEGAWSPRWEFATGEYDYVTSSPPLLSPDNGGEYESLTPTFEWESVEADMYVISVSLEKPSKAKVLSEATKENTIIFEELPETYYTSEESLEPETTYYWRVKAIKNGEESDWSATWEFITPDKETTSNDPDETPQQIVLSQNYPNPFNPTTQIEFSITALQEVSLKVYDLAGRQVADLVSGMLPAGSHQVTFRGDRLASGIYIYRLITDTQSYTKKMTLLK